MKKRSFRGSMDKSRQLDKILEHGYGLATFCYNDVDPDFDDDFQNGVHPYYYEKGQNFPDPDQWGSKILSSCQDLSIDPLKDLFFIFSSVISGTDKSGSSYIV